MKKFLLFSCLLFVVAVGFAQMRSPFATLYSEGLPNDNVGVKEISLHSAYFGSSVTSVIAGEGELNFNANLLYNFQLDSSGWNLPVVGTLTLPITEESLKNFELGIKPFKVVSKSGSKTVSVVHFGANYNFQSAGVRELKAYAGYELEVPIGTSNYPMSFGINPLFSNRNMDLGNEFGGELNVMFPIGGTLGLGAKGYLPFKKGGDPQFLISMIAIGALKK